MGNIFNGDFVDFLKQLNNHEVEYVLVGGYSVILHGYSRTTGDMDILVNKTAVNYKKLERAFYAFGMPVFDMTENNFLNNPEVNVFTFGRQPVAIDIMTEIKGGSFKEIFDEAVDFELEELHIRTININKLVQVKNRQDDTKTLMISRMLRNDYFLF